MLSLQMRPVLPMSTLPAGLPFFLKSLQERDKTGYYANWAKGLEACLLVLKECA